MPCFAFLRTVAATLILAATPFAALHAATATAPIEERGRALDPGEFVWNADGAPDGRVEVVVSLADQRAFVYRGGELIGVSTISSGREGAESPVGRFQILEKRRFHRSNRYNSAPMPFMQRLNWYGVALHAGHVPGYPASHGCIRLPAGFAQRLFAVTDVGTFVFVTEEPLSSPQAALELARAHADAPMPPDRTPEGIRGTR
ncbi:MAG: L,D-transpeptidase family protein [Pseudomonadota bacterium]|nr:L,D-transpeptidase family protein [Pseudomonadota bacterium]